MVLSKRELVPSITLQAGKANRPGSLGSLLSAPALHF
jgi:hypothetical protein